MKNDERCFAVLLASIRAKPLFGISLNAEDVGELIGIHHKRIDYLLNKWFNRGLWDCGVTQRTGWFTDDGIEFVKRIIKEMKPCSDSMTTPSTPSSPE